MPSALLKQGGGDKVSKIVVVGSGVVGLATAMLLAQQGHDVTVFERDDAPIPSSPEEAWSA